MPLWTWDFYVDAGLSLDLLGCKECICMWEEHEWGGGVGAEYYRMNVCITPEFICWNLSPKVIVLGGGGTFGRSLGHEGPVPMNRISVLRKEAPSLWCGREKTALREDSRHRIRQCLDLGLCRLQNCEKWISAAYKLPSLWYFVTAAWAN